MLREGNTPAGLGTPGSPSTGRPAGKLRYSRVESITGRPPRNWVREAKKSCRGGVRRRAATDREAMKGSIDSMSERSPRNRGGTAPKRKIRVIPSGSISMRGMIGKISATQA